MSVGLVLTLNGKDRPGMVSVLSEIVSTHGATWVESRFINLGGRFAGDAHVEVEDSKADLLAAELKALSKPDTFLVLVDRMDEDASNDDQGLLLLELTGPDRVGIIHDLSKVLAKFSISIDELVSETVEASMGGGQTFFVQLSLSVPEGADEEDVMEALQSALPEFLIDTIEDEEL